MVFGMSLVTGSWHVITNHAATIPIVFLGMPLGTSVKHTVVTINLGMPLGTWYVQILLL